MKLLMPFVGCFSFRRFGKNIQQNVKHDFLKCSQLFKLIVEMRTTLHHEEELSLLQFVLHFFTLVCIFVNAHRTPHHFSVGDLYTVLLSFIFAASAPTTSIRASLTNNLEIVALCKPLYPFITTQLLLLWFNPNTISIQFPLKPNLLTNFL